MQTLLLRRSRVAGFVPGMFVFPGGRVDATDADLDAFGPLGGLTLERAASRLGLPGGDPPAIAYYLAAIREAFEETGILVGTRADGSLPATAADDVEVERIRDQLMEGRLLFADALARMGCTVSGGSIEYFAHWITPRRRPRRFDTRFFATRVSGPTTPVVDPREMTEARWIQPAQALAQHAQGEVPMILPTIQALERLTEFDTSTEALEALSAEQVLTVLPGD